MARMSVLPLLEVVASERLTPRMQRVTLGGSGSPALRTLDAVPPAAHVRLLFAEPGAPVVLPTPGPYGLSWPDDRDRPYARSMTVRSLDGVRGEMTIDIALHGDSAAGRWATAARPGDPAGIVGPGGGWTPPADATEVLLAGDEAALPAIAALLEWLPKHARVHTAIEVEDALDEQELARPVRWVHRATGRDPRRRRPRPPRPGRRRRVGRGGGARRQGHPRDPAPRPGPGAQPLPRHPLLDAGPLARGLREDLRRRARGGRAPGHRARHHPGRPRDELRAHDRWFPAPGGLNRRPPHDPRPSRADSPHRRWTEARGGGWRTRAS